MYQDWNNPECVKPVHSCFLGIRCVEKKQNRIWATRMGEAPYVSTFWRNPKSKYRIPRSITRIDAPQLLHTESQYVERIKSSI